MRTSFTAVAAVAACFAPSIQAQSYGSSNASSNVVNLGYAQYRGVSNDSLGITGYYGIRYAQPPLGELRFRAPVDIEKGNNYSASNVMDATQAGPICIQGSPQWSVNNRTPTPQPGSEDCLLLNVLTPQNPSSARLPVLVQIHGGGYAAGSAASSPGFALVNQSQGGLVYVAIQYRLNAFGFLSSTEIRDNGNPNAGLLDQRSALNWVQRNIRAFGGDPAQVTIIGGSAGGGSVMNQMILYGGDASPPFRGVIAEYPWFQPYHNNTVLEAQYREVLNASSCSDLACLRSIDSTALDLASQNAQTVGYNDNPRLYGYGDFYYGPSVDGEVVRDLPSNEFKLGHFTRTALLVNHDQYEGYVFSNRTETTVTEETADLQSLFPYAKESFFTRLYQLYPPSNYNSTLFQRQEIFGDFIISCPTNYMATATSDYGLPTFKLIFNAGSELHGATSPFLFTTNTTQINNLTLGYIMKDYYLSFASNLDPNTKSYSGVSKPIFPAYNAAGSGDFSILDVNYTMIGATPDQDEKPGCDFFHGQSYAVRN